MAEPVRATSGADGPYWRGLAEGRLQLPRCQACGVWHWPAVWRCGACGAWDQAWSEVALAGEVFTWTRTWHRFGGLEGLEIPFVTVVVALDGADHTRMVGRLEGDETGLGLGRRVEGRIGETAFLGEAIPALIWRLTDAARLDSPSREHG